MEDQTKELRPEVRKDPSETWGAPEQLVKWANATRELSLDAVDGAIVDASYPVMVWLLRKYALEGNFNAARAIELWLKWASGSGHKRKASTKNVVELAPNVEFLPRNPKT